MKQLRDELDRSRHHPPPLPSTSLVSSILSEPNPSTFDFQKQYQDLKDKYEQRLNDLHSKDNECVTLKAKVDTYESKEKDLQHYITILKESILIKDQQVNMIQSEVEFHLCFLLQKKHTHFLFSLQRSTIFVLD